VDREAIGRSRRTDSKDSLMHASHLLVHRCWTRHPHLLIQPRAVIVIMGTAAAAAAAAAAIALAEASISQQGASWLLPVVMSEWMLVLVHQKQLPSLVVDSFIHHLHSIDATDNAVHSCMPRQRHRQRPRQRQREVECRCRKYNAH